MMIKRVVVISLIWIALFPCFIHGQCTSSQKKPSWIDGFFQDEKNSYIEAVSAIGYTEAEARNRAANIAIERRSLATGKRVNVETVGNSIVISGSDELTVKSRIIDEYRELCNGEYRVHLLVQTAKNPTFDYEQVKVTESYPFSPRVFVPGMAQLHKGSTGKGIMFIASEIALIGGIVTCESLRSSYESKIKSTHNASIRQDYINKTDNMQNMRNIFIAGAAAVYVWNVIDGIVAKGKKHVLIGDAGMNISPFAMPQQAGGGLTLSFNF